MENLHFPQLPMSIAIMLSAVVILVVSTLARHLLPNRGRTSGQKYLTKSGITEDPYGSLLAKAELLLIYAVANGIELDDNVRLAIYNARLTDETARNADVADALFVAYTRMSTKLKPITAESLMATSQHKNKGVRKYRLIVLALASVVIPFSILSFVSSAISEDIGKHIDEGNSLLVQLRDGLGADFAGPKKLTDAEAIAKVQQLSTTMRSIYQEANELNVALLGQIHDIPDAPLRLPLGLADIGKTLTDMIPSFQDLRHFGQSGRDLVSIFYGAISTSLLPVLYALLGVSANLLRQFEQQIRARTYVQSEANSAHFVVAAIGGGVVGLFNNFTLGQSASIPPLAIAFLVGYAVDVFFSFLENLVQSFANRSDTDVQSKAAKAGA
jgi:hypothetical protein